MGRRDLWDVLRADLEHTERSGWVCLPGLYRRFEFERVLEIGRELYIEAAGEDDRGWALHKIYYRPHTVIPNGEDPKGGASASAGRAA